MAENQQSGQGTQQNAGKQPQTLSWSQPQVKAAGNAPAAANAAKTSPTTAGGQRSSSSSGIAIAFIIGFIAGWLITWSWFDLRSHNGTTGMMASSTEQTATSNDSLSITQTTQSSQSSETASGTTGGDMTSTGSSEESSMTSSATITVPSPQTAGNSVTVSNVSTTDSVWAAVYEDNNGQLGHVLGASRFWPDRQSGTIHLLRSTLPNLTYYVVLVADTPTHDYDVHVNKPLLGSDGKEIMTQFTAQ